MPESVLTHDFQGLGAWVIVCRDEPGLSVVYAGPAAWELLGRPGHLEEHPALEAVLRLEPGAAFRRLRARLTGGQGLEGHVAWVRTGEGVQLPVRISAGRIRVGGAAFWLLTLLAAAPDEGLWEAFRLACREPAASRAAQSLLAFAGGRLEVDRVWFQAAPGRPGPNWAWPQTGGARPPAPAEAPWRAPSELGFWAAEEVDRLAPDERAGLEGVGALAVFPLPGEGGAPGWLGFEVLGRARRWNSGQLGLMRGLAGLVADLLLRWEAEEEQGRRADILQRVADSSESPTFVRDLVSFELLYVNRALARQMGCEPEALVGQKCWEALREGMGGSCAFCPAEILFDADGARRSGGYSWERQCGESGRWYLVRDAVIPWVDGREVHLQSATEITYQKEYEGQLRDMASRDMLTGLYNREWGYRVLQQMLDRVENRQDSSLVFVDLDDLKQVNDSLGHEAGDQMILSIVEVLRSSIRKSDAICRWGGDEFILLLRCGEDRAAQIMEKVAARLKEINQKGTLPFTLSLSYGITSLQDEEGQTADRLISLADRRMYENKLQKKRMAQGSPA